MVGIKCTNRKLVLTRFAPSLQVMGSISRRIDIAVTGGDFQEKIVLSSIRRTWSTGCTVGMRIKTIFSDSPDCSRSFFRSVLRLNGVFEKNLRQEAPKQLCPPMVWLRNRTKLFRHGTEDQFSSGLLRRARWLRRNADVIAGWQSSGDRAWMI